MLPERSLHSLYDLKILKIVKFLVRLHQARSQPHFWPGIFW